MSELPRHVAPTNSSLHDGGAAFVTIVDVERAKHFYRDTLGLTLVSEEPPFALVFDANGTMVRLGMAKKLPEAHGTVLGWQVPEIEPAVQELIGCGIFFERFEGLTQDAKGIWASPMGAKIAWFRDPDGNILSISEHPGSWPPNSPQAE